MKMTSYDLQMAEAAVWERFYNEQDITTVMQRLERMSPEKADEVREKIKDFIFSE